MRIDHGYLEEACEIGAVEWENFRDAMRAHRGGDAGIVGDSAVTTVGDDEQFPFSMETRRIG